MPEAGNQAPVLVDILDQLILTGGNLRALSAIQDAGLSVPHNVGLIGLNDMEMAGSGWFDGLCYEVWASLKRGMPTPTRKFYCQ